MTGNFVSVCRGKEGAYGALRTGVLGRIVSGTVKHVAGMISAVRLLKYSALEKWSFYSYFSSDCNRWFKSYPSFHCCCVWARWLHLRLIGKTIFSQLVGILLEGCVRVEGVAAPKTRIFFGRITEVLSRIHPITPREIPNPSSFLWARKLFLTNYQ